MLQNLKALVVVLGLSLPCLWLLRGWAANYMSHADYFRRCSVWTVLTVSAFAIPNYWLYCVISVPLLWWAGKHDRNPIALVLLLLHVVPPVQVDVPVVGINQLIDISHYRWLNLLILLPALMRQPSTGLPTPVTTKLADLGVIGYLALSIGLASAYTSLTDTMRVISVYLIDAALVYFAFSRLVLSRQSLREAFACLAIAAAPIALVAVWEFLRHWLLYTGLYPSWGSNGAALAWLMRGDALRAQASTGHSMILGFVTAIALAFWLGAVDWSKFHWRQVILPCVILAGCAASISRGGWVVAALIYAVFLLLGPFGKAQIFRQLAVMGAVAVMVAVAPGGDKFIDMLPFVGSDNANIDYRKQLAELSWKLVWNHPWFGDLFVLRHMESLRQGQGIIDTVNVYATVALLYGFVGLALFVMPAMVAVAVTLRQTARLRSHDPVLSSSVAAICAALLGILVMMSVISFMSGISYFYWALLGMAVGITRLDQSVPSRSARLRPVARLVERGYNRNVAR